MDSPRLDRLAKRLATTSNRRSLFRAGLASLIGVSALHPASQESRTVAQSQCGFGQTLCPGLFGGGQCVNTSYDNDNCGSCGNRCPFGTSCQNGACPNPSGCGPNGCGCSFGQTNCPGGSFASRDGCVNLDTDDFNCGSCGFQCPRDLTCSFGVCTCQFGRSLCPDVGGGSCVNTSSDDNHCGACNAACPGRSTCQLGVCTCPYGQTPCLSGFTGPDCVNTLTDDDNCGACGNACPAGTRCLSGQCSESSRPTVPDTSSESAPVQPPTPTTIAIPADLKSLLPEESDLPAGLRFAREDILTSDLVLNLLTNGAEAEPPISDWGWQESVFRVFTGRNGRGTRSGTTYLKVSLHRFATNSWAITALRDLATRRADPLSVTPTTFVGMGGLALVVQSSQPSAVEFSIYVQLETIVAHVYAAAPSGDLTFDALTVARVVARKVTAL